VIDLGHTAPTWALIHDRLARYIATHPAALFPRGPGVSEHAVPKEAAMKMPKPTDADRERFRALVPDRPGVEVKPMFGNLGAFVAGNMFMGLFGSDVGLKLPPAAQEELLAQPGSGPFGPAERPMGGYVTIPGDWSAAQAQPWTEKSLTHVAALPPKKATPKKATPKKGAKAPGKTS
jgi:TfoX/Sxy family transcriptional regulator of competence genes